MLQSILAIPNLTLALPMPIVLMKSFIFSFFYLAKTCSTSDLIFDRCAFAHDIASGMSLCASAFAGGWLTSGHCLSAIPRSS